MARVVLENVSKTFLGPSKELIPAVKDVSLIVEDKELLVLVGPSGSGKSTLLRLVAGLEALSSGTISIDDIVVNKVEPKDRDVAMVFQNYALYPHMTVFENLAFPLKLRKVSRKEIQQRVGAVAELLGLTPYFDRLPKALSGGERQRVAVGRAIVRRPKVFLFDEPLSNLDAQMRVQMRMEIAHLHQQLAATMIYVTHDQTEALTLGQHVAVLRAGAIQQIGKPMDLYHRPANLFVAGFIGSPPMNLFRGRVEPGNKGWFFRADGDQSCPFELSLPTELVERIHSVESRELILGLRPEHITEVSRGPATTSAPEPGRSVRCHVDLVEPLGPEAYVHARAGRHALIARVPPDSSVTPNESILLAFDTYKAHLFDPVTERRL